MRFERVVFLAALLTGSSEGFSFPQSQASNVPKTNSAETMKPWAVLPVGLALAFQVAVSQPDAIFDPFDFSAGPYVLPEVQRIDWDKEPQVLDEAAIVKTMRSNTEKVSKHKQLRKVSQNSKT